MLVACCLLLCTAVFVALMFASCCFVRLVMACFRRVVVCVVRVPEVSLVGGLLWLFGNRRPCGLVL